MIAFAYDIAHSIRIPSGINELDGLLYYPKNAAGLVLFVRGSDGSRFSTRNQSAMLQMNCIKKLDIVPGATHLFEEHGALEDVSRLAKEWFIITWLIK
jgi:putative phosphoribosyl transferase